MSSSAFYIPFQSIDFVKEFLVKKYENLHLNNAQSLAYQNGYSFLYYLEMGKQYVDQAAVAPMATRPVLLFYGCVQWMKACLLTVDPEYPGTTQVLAHGVTARKRKKQGYAFWEDEIKVQKEGLFPYFSDRLFHVKQLTGEKYTMNTLLRRIPELAPVIERMFGSPVLFPLTRSDRSSSVSDHLLKTLEMDVPRFDAWLKSFGLPSSSTKTKGQLDIISDNRIEDHPFLTTRDQQGVSWLPAFRTDYLPLPELMCHYLILYNLSMVCRYETEWWCELLHTFPGHDYPCIHAFLNTTSVKLPLLIERVLSSD
ncbi:YaaC family protein [Alteribacter lacisalsi]|uniref:YaaC family protein n=1 Tax=Alteribacter lacisalsi TaxID=2045244 RepID=UPI001374E40B|nr:YaaC family protein [Alteribacter lacisalsi]